MAAPITLWLVGSGGLWRTRFNTNNNLLADFYDPGIADDFSGSNWVVSATGYSLAAFAGATPAALAAPVLPASGTGLNGSCGVSQIPYTGFVEAGTWSLAAYLIAQAVSGATCSLTFRLYRGTDPTGSGATEITSGVVETNALALASSPQSVSATVSLPAVTLNAEYIFAQVAIHCSVAGPASADCALEVDASAGVPLATIRTPDFTPGSPARSISVVATATVKASTSAGSWGSFDTMQPGQTSASTPSATPQVYDDLVSALATFPAAPSPWSQKYWGFDILPSSSGVNYNRSISESVSAPTDAVTRALVSARPLAESVSAPTDSVARATVVARSVSESVSAPTDSVTRVLGFHRSVSESVSAPTDSVTRAFVGSRSISESIVVPTDAVARSQVLVRSQAESISAPTDSLTRALVSSRSISESASAPTDAVSRTFVGSRSVSESIGAPTDSVARGFLFNRSISESIAAPTDSVVKTLAATRQPAESISAPTDSATRVFTGSRSVAESISAPTDSVARGFVYNRSISESISAPTDVVTRSIAISRLVSESISGPTDSVARGFVSSRSVSESIGAPTDSVARGFAFNRSISESISGPTDSVGRGSVYGRSVSESITAPTDAVSRSFAFNRSISESISAPTDSATRVAGYIRQLTESISAPTDFASYSLPPHGAPFVPPPPPGPLQTIAPHQWATATSRESAAPQPAQSVRGVRGAPGSTPAPTPGTGSGWKSR